MTLTAGLPGLPQAPEDLTVDKVRGAVPPQFRGQVTQEFVDKINTLVQDPILAEQIRNNVVSYASVLKDGKFKLEDYLNAVTYVSYKLMGYNNEESYYRTFPARHAALVAKGTSQKDISAYVSAYNRGKLVNLITEQSLVPSWVLNHGAFQEAINTQVDLMRNAASEKVRCDAANSILTHLAKPKEGNFQLSVEVNENSGMAELKSMLTQLAEAQLGALEGGAKVVDIAAQPLIDVSATEVDGDNVGN